MKNAYHLITYHFSEGFALISVLDSSLRPLPSYSTTFWPASGVVLRRQFEKRIEIRLDTAVLDDPDCRTSSAMSSVSTARRRASEADLVIRISWGEEVLRQRLKMYVFFWVSWNFKKFWKIVFSCFIRSGNFWKKFVNFTVRPKEKNWKKSWKLRNR